MNHPKKHLPQGVVLTQTRHIGFNRKPVQDDSKNNLITGLKEPSSNYPLLNGHRWIDARRKP